MLEHILIIDDHPIVLDGLHLLLRNIRSNAQFTTAVNGADALETVVNDPSISCVFVDLNLPDYHGLDLVPLIKQHNSNVNIVVLSSEVSAPTIHQALSLGVNGVLCKTFSKDIFEMCLVSIDLGRVFLTAEHANDLRYYRESLSQVHLDIAKHLSGRQLEALELMSKGHSNKVISEHMGIAESTVKKHVTSLMEILNAENRTHCVSLARELHIIKD